MQQYRYVVKRQKAKLEMRLFCVFSPQSKSSEITLPHTEEAQGYECEKNSLLFTLNNYLKKKKSIRDSDR